MKTTNNKEKKDLDLEFSLRIQALSNRANLTQIQVAKTLGTNAGRVGNWFQGRNRPKSPMKERLAELFDCSVSYLMTGNPESKEIKVSKDNADTVEEGSGDYLLPLKSEAVDRIYKFLDPWIAGAKQNSDVAAHVLNQLKLNLPHNQLDVLLGTAQLNLGAGTGRPPPAPVNEFMIEKYREEIREPLSQALDEIIAEKKAAKGELPENGNENGNKKKA